MHALSQEAKFLQWNRSMEHAVKWLPASLSVNKQAGVESSVNPFAASIELAAAFVCSATCEKIQYFAHVVYSHIHVSKEFKAGKQEIPLSELFLHCQIMYREQTRLSIRSWVSYSLPVCMLSVISLPSPSRILHMLLQLLNGTSSMADALTSFFTRVQ